MTFLGWLSDPFKGLSDLQLGDEKGTAWITWYLSCHHLVNIPVPWSILEPHSTTICGDFFKPKTQTAWSPDPYPNRTVKHTSQPPSFAKFGVGGSPKSIESLWFMPCNLEFWKLHFPNSQKSPAFFFIWLFSWTSRKSSGHKKKRFLRTLKWRKSGLLHLFPWTLPLLFQAPVVLLKFSQLWMFPSRILKNPCMV